MNGSVVQDELLLLRLADDDRDVFLLFNGSLNGSALNGSSNDTLLLFDDNPYPSGNSMMHIILASVVVTVLMIVVVVGNMLVIIAIATEKSLKNIQNWFIASLAVSDFFLGLVIMPFSLANELMGYWIFGPLWCDIHSALDVLLSTASIMNLCLISLDRYWSITQAIDYLKKRTPLRAAIMICLVWLLSALICIPPLLGWKVERPPEEFPKCELSQDLGYVLYSALGSFYIPSCIMVFVYIRIYFAAKARARRGIRKRPPKQEEQKQSTSFTTVAKLMPLAHIHSLAGDGPFPGGLMIPGAEHGYKSAAPTIVEEAAGPSAIATVESAMAASGGQATIQIPVVTCDLASDVSISDADMSMQENGAAYLEAPRHGVTFIQQHATHPLASAFRDSSQSVNGDLRQTEANTISVAIDNDMVSEFDPSSSDSGVVSKCAVVKPLKLRLMKPIFSRRSKAAKEADKKAAAAKSKARLPVCREVPEVAKLPQYQMPPKPRDPEREKRRVARKKEKRATLILGLIMGSFIACWLPFFLMYIITPLCPVCDIPPVAFSIAFWLGYMNSALNPVIYTIFNKDFRRAFRRILFK
ncbi:alpha-2C adrenergic receptor [Neocloeon triangulifer]|uniref:alpha-2C adrenergic receptor n=1 Tax=Neocloeon triangulifer TaxID=2078957 RepID=UPI00286F44AC|nr:alpha-2C adrenergic receptor [Neocloeon triangulifer]